MLTLWAIAVMLSVHVTALITVTPPSDTNNLPVPPPLNVLSRGPSIPKGHTLRNCPAGTAGGRCPTVATYFISKHKLQSYLNATLPQKMEKMLLCEKVDMAGILGSVISTLTSSLSVLDGIGVGGILGNGGSSSNSEDILSGSQQPQDSQPASGSENDALNGLTGTLGLQKLSLPVNGLNRLTGLLGLPKVPSSANDVADKVSALKESADSALNTAVAPAVKGVVGDLINTVNVDELLLGMKVTKVTVETVNLNLTGDGIHVYATAIVSIGGKGLPGPIVNKVGFKVATEMFLTIGISTSNTKCPTLQVQNKDIAAKKVSILIVEMLTDSLPLPLPNPVPLGDMVAKLLTVELSSQAGEKENSKSCAVAFSDVNECKNSTSLFKYRLRMTFSKDGLSIFYCADAVLNGKSIPVPGSRLPPGSKSAKISLTLSHNLVKIIFAKTAKQSSVLKDGLRTTITKISRSYNTQKEIQATYSVNIHRDRKHIATGETSLTLSHVSKISSNKLVTNIKLFSPAHSVTPPEAIEEVGEIIKETLKKFYFGISEGLNEINVPEGLPPFHLNDAPVVNVNLKDLQAAN
uniref:Uncharacterized protein n=1 Tax=Loxodonta africana TaxID=9785 RepID=G3TDG1_LOXAF